GAMAMLSCYDGMYRGWGKIIAANGVAVVMVDFRNSLLPSSTPDIAPFPAGLNDCVSGLKWAVANAGHLGIDPQRIVVAGESGGAHPATATGPQTTPDGEVGLIQGPHALWPHLPRPHPPPPSPPPPPNAPH